MDVWKNYEGRAYAASWFEEKMRRATRETQPVQDKYRRDIDAVIKEMEALPGADRDWTLLYVLCPVSSSVTGNNWNELISDVELIASAKRLGPEALLGFLQHKSVSSDPSLPGRYSEIAHFLLLNANKLLRPGDADALLACEAPERAAYRANSAWRIGAALLQPARAAEILEPPLQAEDGEGSGSLSAIYLWRIAGIGEKHALVEWLYKAKGRSSSYPRPGEFFLRKVREAHRADTKELMVAILQDPRLSTVDWNVFMSLLEIANDAGGKPLVSREKISSMQPLGTNAVLPAKTVAEWSRLLREAYGMKMEK